MFSLPAFAKLCFFEAVNKLMKVKYQMSTIRNEYPVRRGNSGCLKTINFLEKRRKMNDDAMTDEGGSVGMNQAARKQMKVKLFSGTRHDGVACI